MGFAGHLLVGPEVIAGVEVKDFGALDGGVAVGATSAVEYDRLGRNWRVEGE